MVNQDTLVYNILLSNWGWGVYTFVAYAGVDKE